MIRASFWVVSFAILIGGAQAEQQNKKSLNFKEELGAVYEARGILQGGRLTQYGQELFCQTKVELRKAFRNALDFFRDDAHLAPYSKAAQFIILLSLMRERSHESSWAVVLDDKKPDEWSIADIDNLFGVYTGLLEFFEVRNLEVYRANGTISSSAYLNMECTEVDKTRMRGDIDVLFTEARNNLLGVIWKEFNFVDEFSARRKELVHPGETSLEEIQSHLRLHKLWEYVIRHRLDVQATPRK